MDRKADIQAEFDNLRELEGLLWMALVKAGKLTIALERDYIEERIHTLLNDVNFERGIQGNRLILGHGEED